MSMQKRTFKVLYVFSPVILLIFSLFMLSRNNVVQADEITIETKNTEFYSRNLPIPIYADPETKQPTGRTLTTEIDAWRVFKIAHTTTRLLSYNLGGNQWVKATDYRPQALDIGSSNFLREFYSSGEATTVYSDPYLTQAIGKLDPTISHWAIMRASVYYQSHGNYSFDLGNNQWVGEDENNRAIRQNYFFSVGTPLYNGKGQRTQAINNANYTYKIFDVKTIHGDIYVKLGSDDQWALYDSGTPY